MRAHSFRLFLFSFLAGIASAHSAVAQTELTNGVPVTGQVTPNASVSYTFSGEAGAWYRGSVSETGATYIHLDVSSPCGESGGLGSWYGTFSATGTCTVTLSHDQNIRTGNVSYVLTNVVVSPGVPSGDHDGMLSDNLPVSGSVSPGNIDVWQFNAAYADVPVIQLTQSGSSSIDVDYITPDGTELDSCGTKGGVTTCNGNHYADGLWSVIVYIGPNETNIAAAQNYTLTLSGSSKAPPALVGKDLGSCPTCAAAAGRNGTYAVGDPVNPATGNMFEKVVDYTTSGANPLAFIRYYNSQASTQSVPFAASLGKNWRHNFDRYIRIVSSSVVAAERPDGQIITFSLNGSTWTPDSDIDYALTQSGSTWTLKDHQDVTEVYTAIGSTEAQLETITTPAGYKQTLHYSGTELSSVTDSYNRTLSFTYTGSELTGIKTPDTLQLTYGFASASGGNRLASVGYNTTPATSQKYLYENASFPFALTGITDENGARYATWTFDTKGRCTSSQHAGGAGLTKIAYNDSLGYPQPVITRPLGIQETLKYGTYQNVSKLIEIDRHDPSGTVPDATMTVTYDANGYLYGVADWNGNQTYYVNDAHGDPTGIYEAYGSPAAVTTTIAYDQTWVHKPGSVLVYDRPRYYTETDNTYDATTGNLTRKTITDESQVYGTYAPETQVWNYTYTATGQLHTVQQPRTDLTATTTYGYTGGVLTSIVNPAGQKTTISAYTPGGLPKTIVDPNGVTTTRTYDMRNRLKTSAVTMAAGVRTTTYGYDAAEDLTSVLLPGGATLTNTYDAAHRLTKVTDLLGQTTNYALDALGDITSETLKTGSGATKLTRSDKFDALGRRLSHTGGASQLTRYAYDANGNAVSITDPLGHATAQTFDALNRVSQVTDRAAGLTKYSYDAYGRPLAVITPNGAETDFYYNGYGNLYKQVSPDSGTTTYYYDADNNLIKKTDALSVVATYTYDGLDRRTGIAYPAAPTENVTFTYDQAGHGKGIGRLTGMTDPSGTFSRSYDERGNITAESHTHGSHTLTNSYGYDAAGLQTSLTYPDGMILTQARDTMERVTGLSLKPTSAGAAQTVLSGIGYDPFGPVTGFSYGNGITDSRTYDGDYRITNVTDSNSVENLTYALNANDNVTGITDAITTANKQTLTYDTLDRLKTAVGSYGSQSFAYDGNGNRTSYNGATWTYIANTNRLTAMGTATVTPNANGSVTAVSGSPALGYTYYNSGRLKTATKGGSTVLTYVYDGFGQRTVATDTAQRFYQYDAGGTLIEQTDNTDTVKLDYIYLNGLPVATFVPNASTGTLSFLHTDRLGAPRRATNSGKTIGWTAEYQPFGAASFTVGTIANNLRLPGQEYEASTGEHYNGMRDYMPGWGRYLESDPIGLAGGQASTYAYASLNPEKLTDPSGLFTNTQNVQLMQDAARLGSGLIETAGGVAAIPFSETGVGAAFAFYGLVQGGTDTWNAFSSLENDVYTDTHIACIAHNQDNVPTLNDGMGDALALASDDPSMEHFPDALSTVFGLSGDAIDKSLTLTDILTQQYLNSFNPSLLPDLSQLSSAPLDGQP